MTKFNYVITNTFLVHGSLVKIIIWEHLLGSEFLDIYFHGIQIYIFWSDQYHVRSFLKFILKLYK